MEGLISIGQLSSEVGISIRTIRYYEEVGIFKPAKTADSNYRYYGPAEIEKLGIIIFLRKIGFSLQDIKIVLSENRRMPVLHIIGELQKKMDHEITQMLEKIEVLRALAKTIRGSTEVNPLEVMSDTIHNKKEQIHMELKDNFPVKVIGIGSASTTAINKLNVNGAKMDIIHVDQSMNNLMQSDAYCKILLSDSPAEEEWTQILNAIKGSDILFLLASLDGGYVSSMAPLIAREARKLGILTVSLITEEADGNVETGLTKLRENVDLLLDLPLEIADDSMNNAVNCLLSLVRATFTMDLEDFKFLIREKRAAQFGISRATGEKRAVDAVERLLHNPQLVNDISTADSIILNITGSKDLHFDEVKLIVETIQLKIKPEANMVFGTVIDEEAQESLVLAIVAAGTVHRKQKIIHTLWTTTGNKLYV
ncbi:MerR family transcriptional regulator [Cohnella soli]|uniref:MerR family transcriptional regulator n=1 Tax=Cohnella soli TaxID=425005 RepID=A0ABW0HZL9_9BACL